MIGETLGQRYRLLRLLGRGGMGSVYEAEHVDTREHVAVKVLHSHLLLPGGEGPRRFRREAAAILAIRSDHIVRVLDAGSDDATGRLYLVTEHLQGEDLQSLLDRIGPVAERGALAVAAQALVGLCDAHAAGVIHRDIKPANIFLARRPDGTLAVKLLDFGIAKIRIDPLTPVDTPNVTTTGGFLGSPLYMSPEQIQNSRDVDHRADLWSLGSALYAALAGRAPHQHLPSLGQLLVAICVSQPPPLMDVAPWVTPQVAEVVHRALQLAPEARYASAESMLAAIRRLAPREDMVEDMLVSSGRRVSMDSVRPLPAPSDLPPPPATPRVVVAPAGPVRWDTRTEHALPAPSVPDVFGATLGSAPDLAPPLPPEVARSGVPVVGARPGARLVTVDPRRFLGQSVELWTFSLDVHRHLSSLLSRIWKAMRRAGARVPPMTYGTAWVLYEPRTDRVLSADRVDGDRPPSLEEAGVRPGTILWIVAPDAVPTRDAG